MHTTDRLHNTWHLAPSIRGDEKSVRWEKKITPTWGVVRGKNNKTHVFILPSRSREVLLLNVTHQQSYPSRDEEMSRDL